MSEQKKITVSGFAIRCSIVISEISLSGGARLVWKGAIRPPCGWLCGCAFHIFTEPGKKKTSKNEAKKKFCPPPAPTCAVLLSYFILSFFFPSAFKASSQKSSLKGIRPHVGRSLPIMKWWEVEKLIFSLACIRRGVRVRERATHANVAIETRARLQLTSGRKCRRKEGKKKEKGSRFIPAWKDLFISLPKRIKFAAWLSTNKMDSSRQRGYCSPTVLPPDWQLACARTIAEKNKGLELAVCGWAC